MKPAKLLITLLAPVASSFSLLAEEYNLQELADSNGLALHNRQIKTASTEYPGVVYLSKVKDDGLAWIKDISFSNGVIEIEIRGANKPGQSFVGIAFHGQDNKTFDAVYVRPFNFQNQSRKSHSLQYISMPKWDWKALRAKHPGKYESALDPAPQPEDWVHLKLVIKDENLAIHINGSKTPELEATLLNKHPKGTIGLWVGNGSDGEFRNLIVNPD